MKKPEKKYDVFISYRRDGGDVTAKHLRDALTEKGYKVFLDVESLRKNKEYVEGWICDTRSRTRESLY